MKKVLALILCLALSMSIFAGCTNTNGNDSSSETSSSSLSSLTEESSAAEESSALEDNSGATDDSALNDFVDAVNEQIDINQLAESLSDSYSESLGVDMKMSAAILARDGKFVYSFAFGMDFTEDQKKTMADSLESTLSTQAATYEALIEPMEQAGIENPIVVVEYLDKDGEAIFYQEYK